MSGWNELYIEQIVVSSGGARVLGMNGDVDIENVLSLRVKAEVCFGGSRVISLHRKLMGARQFSKKAAREEVINPLLDTTFTE